MSPTRLAFVEVLCLEDNEVTEAGLLRERLAREVDLSERTLSRADVVDDALAKRQ